VVTSGRASEMLRTLLAGIVAALVAVTAQAQEQPTRIGVVMSGSEATTKDFVAGLKQGLAEVGLTEGRKVILDIRYAHGRIDDGSGRVGAHDLLGQRFQFSDVCPDVKRRREMLGSQRQRPDRRWHHAAATVASPRQRTLERRRPDQHRGGTYLFADGRRRGQVLWPQR